jgi:hypothetical protein
MTFRNPSSSRALALSSKTTSGQKIGHVYFEDEPGRRSAAKLPTRDEARRIAVNIAKLPGLSVASLISIK